jgi:hypothetical protein
LLLRAIVSGQMWGQPSMGGQELQKEENCLKTYGLYEVMKCIYILYVLETFHLITLCYCHFTAFQLEILMCERERK